MAATFTFQDDKTEDNTALICDDVLAAEYQKFLIDEDITDNPAGRKQFVHKQYAEAINDKVIHLRLLRKNTEVSDIDRESGIS